MTQIHLYVAAVILYPLLFVAGVVKTLLKLLFQFAVKPKSIQDEIALVTGGAGGFGRGLCFELAQRGCHIAIVDVDINGAQQVAKQLQQKYSIKAKAYQVDVSDHDAVVELAPKVRSDFGGDVTLLFNNAGIIFFKNIFDPDWKDVQRMVNVNVTAHMWLNEVFLPRMKLLNRGHIIATASIAGLVPLQHYPIYAATKFAVNGLMRSLRLTLRAEGYTNIKLSTIYPFFMHTNAQVTSLIEDLNVSSLLPALEGDEAVKCAIAGVLREEREIIMPHIFELIYRMHDCLPSDWQEFGNHLVSRTFSKRFLALQQQAAAEKATATTTTTTAANTIADDK